jgi:CRP/FNR family cyclic AMP-dependent transcriptional regulator
VGLLNAVLYAYSYNANKEDYMSVKDDLKKFKIFQGLNDRELDLIANIAREEAFDEGQRIFEEKALAANLYLALEGKVEVKLKGKDNTMVKIDEVGPGEIFGWSSIAAPSTFTAATWTLTPARIIVLNGRNLRDIFEKNNHIGYRILKEIAAVIARRLKAMQSKLVAIM